MHHFTLTLILLLTAWTGMHAQNFLDGAHMFSKDKEAYITLQSGETITGTVDKIKRTKGLIESIALKTPDGKVTVLRPHQISHMYLPPHGVDKLMNINRKAMNMSRWDDDHSAHAQHIKEGYVFFETAEVILKKQKATMLLQLVNPGFADRIKVYFDPNAMETGGTHVGGMQLTGGAKKSYYVSKDGATAERLKKSGYKKAFDALYSGCPAFEQEFAKNRTWNSVERHVFYYSEHCK